MAQGLKKQVVVVNEFTVKQADGSGSRGATPGQYITRYMARDLATETVEPIERSPAAAKRRAARRSSAPEAVFESDEFVRYMVREDATERAEDRRGLKEEMLEGQGDGGVAFGYGQASLSHDELHAASRDVQRLFDEGKTVMKTVVSFDHDYLVEHGLVPEGFVPKDRGDYRGEVDQMKLRLAIMHGVERMNAQFYDDLRWVAVIQVDTLHVHCHLAMVDAGEGSKVANGEQRGKITRRGMAALRRGIDLHLDRNREVQHLGSAVAYERRNVQAYVKRWAHRQVLRESLPQFLLACLPEDRRLWRSSTNHRSMKKANRIVHELVEEVLSRPGSPMATAVANVESYANVRARREDLDADERQRLVDDGRAMIVERGVNAVYGLLRTLPEDLLRVRTSMLEVMGMDREELAAAAARGGDKAPEEDLVGFGFRLRSYGSRLRHHTQERERLHGRVREWEAAHEVGAASEESRALYEHYRTEEDWHARCAAKYRHYLAFVPARTEWHEGWEEIESYGDRLLSLEAMSKDPSLRRTKDLDEAERLGLEAYGQPGGSLVARGGAAADEIAGRIAAMRAVWQERVEDFRVGLAAKGLVADVRVVQPGEDLGDGPDAEGLPVDGRGRRRRRATRPQGPPTPTVEAVVSPGPEHPFELVKGLDMHHLRWDFSTDSEVGPRTLARYRASAEERAAALDGALEYLQRSGQAEAAHELPVHDVETMLATAAEVEASGMLASRVAELHRRRQALRRSRTVEITGQLASSIVSRVDLAALEPLEQPDIEPSESIPGEGPAPRRGAELA